jgi:hypothetical protein
MRSIKHEREKIHELHDKETRNPPDSHNRIIYLSARRIVRAIGKAGHLLLPDGVRRLRPNDKNAPGQMTGRPFHQPTRI